MTDSKNIAGDTLEIFTKPQTGNYNFGVVYAQIKHTELLDADIKAYVNFSTPTLRRENIIIGRGTGKMATYYLGTNGGIDRNIDQNGLKIMAGNKYVTNFYYNIENATVDLIADEGVDVTASYNYDVSTENWLELAKQKTEIYGDSGLYVSRFIYRSSDSSDKKTFTVKFSLTRNNATVDNEDFGLATGRLQTFALPHRAKTESIAINGSWHYNENTQILKLMSAVNDTLKISYDWTGILPQVESFVVGAEYAV